MNEYMIKQDILEVGKRMYARGFVASNDGNISVRLSENEILITASGVSKGYMETSDLVKVDMDGKVLSGDKKPSSEIKMHLVVYRNRPDVNSVCHAHPQIATAFAVSRKQCDKIALPEVIFSIGRVALSNYATPSTQEVPDSISDIITKSDAVLLANHGALTVGKDVFDAYYKMETLEHFAGITLYARLLGGEVGLDSQQVTELFRVRKEVFGKSEPAGMGDGFCGSKAAEESNDEEKIKNMIEKVIKEELAKMNLK